MTSEASREVLEALRLFGPLRRQIARLLPDEVGPGGLTALRVIAAGEHPRVSDVAAAQHVALPVASRQVRQLEEQGLVSREVCADDRRAHRLELTPPGRVLLDQVQAELAATIDAVLADWPPDDAAQLGRLMARLHDGLARAGEAVPTPGTTPESTDLEDAR